MRRIAIIILIITTTVLTSCKEAKVPKPRGYFRIELPEHEYVRFDSAALPYTFEIPTYARVEPDHSYDAEPHWINIKFPRFKSQIHVTYRDIRGIVDAALEDSRKLVYKHTVKADAIGENFYECDSLRVFGELYQIKGNAATPVQFALTDSTRHLFRGSLYFYCVPNKDSLAPVDEFLEEDVAHLIETFSWKY